MLNEIQQKFQEAHNPENALKMHHYMQERFQFLGIKAPERRAIQKQFSLQIRPLPIEIVWDMILQLWELEEREYQYMALDLLKWRYKKPTPDDLEMIKHLITTQSWWDTVDYLSAHTLGLYLMHFQDQRSIVSDQFIKSCHLWLQRSTIIFQLKYKDQTDTSLLYHNIIQLNSNRDFFIQKAIGWALREYSKTDKKSVINFLKNHPEIDKLALREASKYL